MSAAGAPSWRRHAAGALACTGLILLLPALTVPVMRISMLGRVQEAGVWEGVVALFDHGEILVGTAVVVCSVILPAVKLAVILWLVSGLGRAADRHAAHRAVEILGRWGMLDVLLVAVLIAFLKLGDTARITPGPGLAIFAAMVAASLAASAVIDRSVLGPAPETMKEGT